VFGFALQTTRRIKECAESGVAGGADAGAIAARVRDARGQGVAEPVVERARIDGAVVKVDAAEVRERRTLAFVFVRGRRAPQTGHAICIHFAVTAQLGEGAEAGLTAACVAVVVSAARTTGDGAQAAALARAHTRDGARAAQTRHAIRGEEALIALVAGNADRAITQARSAVSHSLAATANGGRRACRSAHRQQVAIHRRAVRIAHARTTHAVARTEVIRVEVAHTAAALTIVHAGGARGKAEIGDAVDVIHARDTNGEGLADEAAALARQTVASREAASEGLAQLAGAVRQGTGGGIAVAGG